MDPASILAIVGGVCMVVKGCIETYDTWSSYQKRKNAERPSNSVKEEEDKLSQELKVTPSKIQQQYNQIVIALGGTFATNGDKIVQQDLKKIIGKQRKLNKHLARIRKLRPELQSSNIQQIGEYADSIRTELSQALLNFARRSTSLESFDRLLERTKSEEMELEPGTWPRNFCYGALLLQSDDSLDGETLADDPRLYILGFSCKYCHLQVGDYRMSRTGRTLISTRFLAASHVVSCPSFADRRAAYKCLACHAKYLDIDFPSAAALEQHLKKHPNSKFLKEKETVDVLNELHVSGKDLGIDDEEEESEEEESGDDVEKEAVPRQEGNAPQSLPPHYNSRPSPLISAGNASTVSDVSKVTPSLTQSSRPTPSNSPGSNLLRSSNENHNPEPSSNFHPAITPRLQHHNSGSISTAPVITATTNIQHIQSDRYSSNTPTPEPRRPNSTQPSYTSNQPTPASQPPYQGYAQYSPPPPSKQQSILHHSNPSDRTMTMQGPYSSYRGSYEQEGRTMSIKSTYSPRDSNEYMAASMASHFLSSNERDQPVASMNDLNQGYHAQKGKIRKVEEKEERNFLGVKKKKK